MNNGKIKRKIIKAGVELRVQKEVDGAFEHVAYFANRMEAHVHAQKSFSGKNFRVTTVRLDATPMSVLEERHGRG